MKTKFIRILTQYYTYVAYIYIAFFVQTSFAQEKTISGTVSNELGSLPGVTVLKKGTRQGTQTDFDGNYSLKAKTGDILVFSFVGMKTFEKIVKSSNRIDVVLKNDNLLNEVIVVGYGTSTKQAYTGTAKTVKAKDLEAKSFSNISQALTGEVAGVNVISSSGQPGTPARIRIRGFGSISGNKDPLYVVDGVPFSGEITSINPSDIKSTTILKDATATAIYGSRGANGVILITTKKGKIGSSSIEVAIKTGVNFRNLPNYTRITSPDEYIELSWQGLYNNGAIDGKNPVDFANKSLFSGRGIDSKYNLWNTDAAGLINPVTGKVNAGVTRRYTPENFENYGLQTSIRTEANLSMSGGSGKTRYFSSFGYLDDKGYTIGSSYKRYTTRLNLEHKPTEWLTATANLGYSFGQTMENSGFSDIFSFVYYMPPIYPLFKRDAAGNLTPDPVYGGNLYDDGKGRGYSSWSNPIRSAKYNLYQTKRYSFNGNFSFKIDLAKGLDLQTRYGVQLSSSIRNIINNPFYGFRSNLKGYLSKSVPHSDTQDFLNMLTYQKTFGNHNLKVLAAWEVSKSKSQSVFFTVHTVVNLEHGLDDPSNYIKSGSTGGSTNLDNLESYFTQVNYNYLGKYFFSGSIRRDGSSRFYKNKWGTFGSVGAAWILSKENFMSNANFINNLKLKVSYGLTGSKGTDYYSGRNSYDASLLDGKISLSLNKIQYSNLTWETSKMFQTGVEFSMFNNVFEGNLDYYIKNTNNLFFSKNLPLSSGIPLSSGASEITVNDGVLKNQGFEFDLTTHIINKQHYQFDFTVNGSMVNNKITTMPIDSGTGKQKVLNQGVVFGNSVGRSIYDYYMRDWAGVDPADGMAMWYVNYYDANGNGTMDSGEEIGSLTEYLNDNPTNANAISETTTKRYQDATQRYIGKSSIPKLSGAFRLAAKIYNFSISSQFTYSLGGYAYDSFYAALMSNTQAGNKNWHTDIRNSWKKPGDITNVPRLFSGRETDVNETSTRFLTSRDYLALNNVRVGYSLPSKLLEKVKIANVNIWLSGDNLLLFNARKGFNTSTSESGRGNPRRYPLLTTITLGVSVKF